MKFNDDGVRSHNQMQGVDSEGNLRNIKVDSSGYVLTKAAPITEEDSSAIKTLLSDAILVGSEETSIEINKKVSKIEVANYSNTAKVFLNVNEKKFTIAPNLSIGFNFNETVASMSFTSNEEDVQIQYLVEGEE